MIALTPRQCRSIGALAEDRKTTSVVLRKLGHPSFYRTVEVTLRWTLTGHEDSSPWSHGPMVETYWVRSDGRVDHVETRPANQVAS